MVTVAETVTAMETATMTAKIRKLTPTPTTAHQQKQQGGHTQNVPHG
jgi:hypothetical protein